MRFWFGLALSIFLEIPITFSLKIYEILAWAGPDQSFHIPIELELVRLTRQLPSQPADQPRHLDASQLASHLANPGLQDLRFFKIIFVC